MSNQTTKQSVYAALSEREGVFVSGEDLSLALGLSRTAVWKAITALKDSGHTIETSRGHGYRLLSPAGDLSAESVRSALPAVGVTYLASTGSTNDVAKETARAGAPHGSLVVADEQTMGRGRLGRVWHSPPGMGLWFSVVIRPGAGELPLLEAHRLTGVAAVAACRGIGDACGVTPQVKWPNDVFMNLRKVGGILLESGSEAEFLSWAVVGIGINATTETGDFPAELRDTASSIRIATGQVVDRTLLLKFIHNRLMEAYDRFMAGGWDGLLAELSALSCVIGEEVSVTHGNKPILTGVAEGLDPDGSLLVRTGEQGVVRVSVGDVSLRLG